MKNQMKNMALAAVLTTGLFGSTVFAGEGNEKPSIENNRLKNRVEYQDMQQAMNVIDAKQASIEALKAEKKIHRDEDNTIALHMTKKELRKARVDLLRARAYLRIDKHDLKQDQKVAIAEQKQEIKEAKKELRKAKREMRKSKRKKNLDQYAKNTDQVAHLEQVVESKTQSAEAYEEDVDEFFAYLDVEIDETLDK